MDPCGEREKKSIRENHTAAVHSLCAERFPQQSKSKKILQCWAEFILSSLLLCQTNLHVPNKSWRPQWDAGLRLFIVSWYTEFEWYLLLEHEQNVCFHSGCRSKVFLMSNLSAESHTQILMEEFTLSFIVEGRQTMWLRPLNDRREVKDSEDTFSRRDITPGHPGSLRNSPGSLCLKINNNNCLGFRVREEN